MEYNFKNGLGIVDGDNGRWLGLMIASNNEIEMSVFFCQGGICELLSTNMDTEVTLNLH